MVVGRTVVVGAGVVVVGWVVVVVGATVVVVDATVVVVGLGVPPLGTFEVPVMVLVAQPGPLVVMNCGEVPETATLPATCVPHILKAAAAALVTKLPILESSILTSPPAVTRTPPAT